MSIKNLEKSPVLSAKNGNNFKKTNSGKVTGLALGATFTGVHFLDLNQDGSFVKLVKNYKKSVHAIHPIAAFLLSATVIMVPLIALGTMLDNIADTINKEKSEKKHFNKIA